MSDKDEENAADSVEATRSGRHIKRRRFDDELVESSLQSPLKKTSEQMAAGRVSPIGTIIAEKGRTSETKSKDISEPPSVASETSQTCRALKVIYDEDFEVDEWKPSDDLLLINSVIQNRDMELVFKGTKFSFPFRAEQVEGRWRQLLYSERVSHRSVFNKLHADTLKYMDKKSAFSEEEEDIIASIVSSALPPQEVFAALITSHSETFLPSRTAKNLQKHWLLMKQFFLLNEQNVPLCLSERGIPLNFSDVEDELADDTIKTRRRDYDLDYELRQLQRCSKKEMKTLESEMPLWQSMIDSVTGSQVADFDNQTLAVLRGRLVRYLMRSKEISLGRSSREISVDIDFSLEGPAYKVSRRQAIIKLRSNGEFVFANEGKRAVYIDGKPVLTGNKHRLNHNSVVELAGLRFVFLVNQQLLSSGLVDSIQ